MSVIKYYSGDSGPKKCEVDSEIDNGSGLLVPHGSYVRYWRDQTKASEGQFLSGKKDGPWTSWYITGNIEQVCAYTSGVMVGPFVSYYSTGVLASSGTMSVGVRGQTWNSWYSNGQLKSSGAYTNGLMSGDWSFWEEDGTPLPLVTYLNDMIVT
jgi:antitoxin component YwqK of YwqJK toxin-antitoxin module